MLANTREETAATTNSPLWQVRMPPAPTVVVAPKPCDPSSTKTPHATCKTPCWDGVCQGEHGTAHSIAQHARECACHQAQQENPTDKPASASHWSSCRMQQKQLQWSACCCKRALAHSTQVRTATTTLCALLETRDACRVAGLASPTVHFEDQRGGHMGEPQGRLAAEVPARYTAHAACVTHRTTHRPCRAWHVWQAVLRKGVIRRGA